MIVRLTAREQALSCECNDVMPVRYIEALPRGGSGRIVIIGIRRGDDEDATDRVGVAVPLSSATHRKTPAPSSLDRPEPPIHDDPPTRQLDLADR
jgi:hypothetical protein